MVAFTSSLSSTWSTSQRNVAEKMTLLLHKKLRCGENHYASNQYSWDRLLLLPIHWSQTQSLIERSVLTELQPEPVSLFIHTLFVYRRRRDSFLHLLKGNKKAGICWQEHSKVCHKMYSHKIEGDKHNVVYICRARLRGRHSQPLAQGPPYKASRASRFVILGFHVAWLRDVRVRSAMFVSEVTPICSDIAFKQKKTFFLCNS